MRACNSFRYLLSLAASDRRDQSWHQSADRVRRLGQRIFFLHDGRTSDLIGAIRAHQSTGSEANGVINRYNSLAETQKQHLLNS
jgi:CxxC motif-containing protein (DUF1111 family)